ncbi:MAG: hypothetical protein JEY79_19375 [Pseudodesulfovibrio sp.]|nr:hypothetical protein [Pseudodesulfovibrio sp.]
MGAASEHRGNMAIRNELLSDCYTSVRRSYLSQLEQSIRNHTETEESLKAEIARARALIARLRAEKAVLKNEQAAFVRCITDAKKHPLIVKDAKRKYAVCLVSAKLRNAKLI